MYLPEQVPAISPLISIEPERTECHDQDEGDDNDAFISFSYISTCLHSVVQVSDIWAIVIIQTEPRAAQQEAVRSDGAGEMKKRRTKAHLK